MDSSLKEFLEYLRCPACRSHLSAGGGEGDAVLRCAACPQEFPVRDGIPRMLLAPLRDALLNGAGGVSGFNAAQVKTARSFGYEWTQFTEMYEEWEANFHGYAGERREDFFRGKRVLDAGCGIGRHAFYASKYGAHVWAVDLGPAVETARRNNAGRSVKVVQADLYSLPFEPESFDFIYSFGVLHHLPDPEGAFQRLLTHLKPGGEIVIYLYWQPEGQPVKRALLGAVTAARHVTTRLPPRGVHALAYPAAVAAYGLFVWPYRVLRHVPGLRRFAERLPMKQYAEYPFRVCVNDQLDRLSAPIENRYTRAEAEAWLRRTGLENIEVRANFGWVLSGRKPSRRESANGRRAENLSLSEVTN